MINSQCLNVHEECMTLKYEVESVDPGFERISGSSLGRVPCGFREILKNFKYLRSCLEAFDFDTILFFNRPKKGGSFQFNCIFVMLLVHQL